MILCIKKIELKTDKFGEKKLLYTDSGEMHKVNKTNKVFDYIEEPGKYEVSFGEFKGHKFIQTAKFIEPVNLPFQAEQAKKVAVATGIPLDRVNMEMAKQQEIKLQCYAGIAKEICIHNASLAKCEVGYNHVMNLAKDLLKAHDIIIDLHKNEQLPPFGKAWDTDVKALFEVTENLHIENKEKEEDIEPPF